jgi:hypothetical protein
MVRVKLIGSPLCRRYQKMRASVLHEAERLGVAIHIEEIGDDDALSQFNPLSLPMLYIQGNLIAKQNPPQAQEISRALQKLS